MNAMVTGCAGFIGSRVSAILMRNGDHAVERLNSVKVGYFGFRGKGMRGEGLRGDGSVVFGLDRRGLARRRRGFTLIELVVALAILGILISIAVPRYLASRRTAYKTEANNILEEAKTLEWAYYQQYNLFDATGSSIGLAAPGNMHWNAPTFGGTANQSVSIQMTGQLSPISPVDSIWVLIYSDGSSGGGASF